MVKKNLEFSSNKIVKSTYESSRQDLKISFVSGVFMSISSAIGQGIFSL